jgi:hypothetical protein
MFEKLLLAITVTFSLSLFMSSGSLTTSRTISGPMQESEPAQLIGSLASRTLLQNLFQPKAPGS